MSYSRIYQLCITCHNYKSERFLYLPLPHPPTPPRRLNNSLEQLKELKKVPYRFIIKDTNREQPKEETQRVKSGRVPNPKLPCPLSMESEHITI